MAGPSISPLRNFFHRPPVDWFMLAEAVASLLWSKLKLSVFPFFQLATGLGTPQAETLIKVTELQRAVTSKISWAVQTGARYIPLRLVCLPQAMAANLMLSRRGIDSTLYLGVRIDKADAFTAHAWTRTGSKWVTGGKARHGQTTVACFARTDHTRSSGTGWRIVLGALSVLALVLLTLWPVPLLYEANTPGHAGWLRDLGHAMGQDDFAFNVGGMMVITGLLHSMIYGASRAPWRYRWQIATALAALITLLECAQLILPHRHFDLADIAAGTLGILLLTLPWTRAAWR